MPEADFTFPVGRANRNTYDNVGQLDVIYSFWNHKRLFMETNPGCYRLPNIASEIGDLLKTWAQVRLGHRSCEDLGVLGEDKETGKLGAGQRPDGTRIPAILIGSGPSMDEALPLMKDWEGAIFCNSSQGGALIYHGRDPDYVDVCDNRIADWEMKVPYNWKKTVLITHPGMMPSYLKWWKGKKYLTRIYEPGHELYRRIWPAAYSWIRTHSLPFANQPPWALSHALALGYDPIFLVGCDFGFPNGITSMTRYYREGRRWHQTPGRDATWAHEMYGDRLLLADNGVPTSALFVHYRNQLLRIVCLDCPQVFCMEGGIVDERQMPIIHSIEELVRNQGRGYEHLYRTPEQIRSQTERFLATRKMFFLPFQDGHRFVGMGDWRRELRLMVDILNEQGAGIDYDIEYARLEELTKDEED